MISIKIWKFIIQQRTRNKTEMHQIASNHSSHTEIKDFMKLYKDYTKEPFSYFSERYNFIIR